MKKLIYSLLCSLVTFATFAQADTTKRDEVPKTPSGIIENSNIVDVMAEFPGGRKEMVKFLGNKIKVPAVVIKDSLNGQSVIKFAVETDGSISNVTISKSMAGCPECDTEAVRVIKMMPNWTPAELDGKPVRIYFVLPIRFKI